MPFNAGAVYSHALVIVVPPTNTATLRLSFAFGASTFMMFVTDIKHKCISDILLWEIKSVSISHCVCALFIYLFVLNDYSYCCAVIIQKGGGGLLMVFNVIVCVIVFIVYFVYRPLLMINKCAPLGLVYIVFLV